MDDEREIDFFSNVFLQVPDEEREADGFETDEEDMDIGQNEINENTEKLLFAEDFMAYVMFLSGHDYKPSKAERFRPFVYNAYKKEMNEVVGCLIEDAWPCVNWTFDVMNERNMVDIMGFKDFVKTHLKVLFKKGFESDKFLLCSAFVATLAVKFYRHGLQNIPDEAVLIIVRALRYNVDRTGWSALYETAKRYLDVFRIIDRDSPLSQREVDNGNEEEEGGGQQVSEEDDHLLEYDDILEVDVLAEEEVQDREEAIHEEK